MTNINFRKLAPIAQIPNGYNIISKRKFGVGFKVNPTKEEINNILDFGWNMTFGKAGEHRKSRSGGTIKRSNYSVFQDVVTGKLGELAFYRYCLGRVDNISILDLDCYGLGEWDKSDFDVTFNHKTYSCAIKTTKHFGELLLLETKDWEVRNSKAVYMPNNDKGVYDYIIFCRVKSNINNIDIPKNLSKNDFLNCAKGNLDAICEVSGCINNKDLVKIIDKKHIIHKGDLLNGKTKMDATNYYIQSGCLRKMKRIN